MKMRDFRLNGGFPKRKRMIFWCNGGFAKRKRMIFASMGDLRKRVIFVKCWILEEKTRDFRLNGGFAK